MRHELEIAVVQQRYEDKVTSGILEVSQNYDAARISTRSRNCRSRSCASCAAKYCAEHCWRQSMCGAPRQQGRCTYEAARKNCRPEFYLHVEMVAKRSQRDFRNVAREKKFKTV